MSKFWIGLAFTATIVLGPLSLLAWKQHLNIIDLNQQITQLQQVAEKPPQVVEVEKEAPVETWKDYALCKSDDERIAWHVPANMNTVRIKIFNQNGSVASSYDLPNWAISIEPRQTITLESK
jgi:hypothetical protein